MGIMARLLKAGLRWFLQNSNFNAAASKEKFIIGCCTKTSFPTYVGELRQENIYRNLMKYLTYHRKHQTLQ